MKTYEVAMNVLGLFLSVLLLLTAAFDADDLPETNYYAVQTQYGQFVIRLYDETPIHRDNFKRLAADGFYDGTTFHRIIEGFMIQGGDPHSRDDDPFNDGGGDPGYTLEAEIVPGRFHKRGAVAAARTGDDVNPERRSSGSQFYVVQGMTFNDFMLDQIEQQVRATTGDADFAFADSVRSVYQQAGGAPNLDGQYTVFAEVVQGFDVLDAVAAADTPRKAGRHVHPQLLDRPFEPVTMTVRPMADFAD